MKIPDWLKGKRYYVAINEKKALSSWSHLCEARSSAKLAMEDPYWKKRIKCIIRVQGLSRCKFFLERGKKPPIG